ncbi:MAG TPA: hypothetical protein VGC54_11325 [Planctomycetota bacterium]
MAVLASCAHPNRPGKPKSGAAPSCSATLGSNCVAPGGILVVDYTVVAGAARTSFEVVIREIATGNRTVADAGVVQRKRNFRKRLLVDTTGLALGAHEVLIESKSKIKTVTCPPQGFTIDPGCPNVPPTCFGDLCLLSVAVGDLVPISFSAFDPDDIAIVTLVLRDAGGGETVIAHPLFENDGPLSVTLDSSLWPLGDFDLVAKIVDAKIASNECTLARINVCIGNGDCPPLCEIREPASNVCILSGAGSISAVYCAVDRDSVAELKLYLDVDGDFLTVADQFLLDPPGTILENNQILVPISIPVAGYPDGTYHLIGHISDGVFEEICVAPGLVTIHPTCTTPPALTITNPAFGDTVNVHLGDPFTIEWEAFDPDSVALVYLYMDLDGDPLTLGDQYLVPGSPFLEVDGPDSVTIPDSSVFPGAAGSYTVFGVIDDGVNPPVTAFGGMINITTTRPPTITILEPSIDISVEQCDMFVVEWIDDDDDDDAAIRIYLEDVVTFVQYDVFNGIDTNGVLRSVTVDPATIPVGTYCVKGTAFDGVDTAMSTAPGKVTIELCDCSPTGQGLGMSEDDEIRKGLDVLADCSVVMAGGFKGLGTFGAFTLTSQKDEDAWAAKTDASGSVIWVRQGQSPNEAKHFGVAAMPDGGLVATGEFVGSITYDKGGANETTLLGVEGDDVPLARYYPDGRLAWAVAAVGADKDEGYSVEGMSDSSVVVVGFFRKDLVFGSGAAKVTLTANKDRDAYIARYASDGTLMWARRMGGPKDDEAYHVKEAPDGSIVVTGRFRESITFAGPGGRTLTGKKYDDVFVARYLADGTLSWAISAGGDKVDFGMGVAVRDDNFVGVSGFFEGSATFGTGAAAVTLTSQSKVDAFVALYDPAGVLVWAVSVGGSDEQIARSLSFHPASGDIYAAGVFKKAINFNAGGANSISYTGDKQNDAWVARFDAATGEALWASRGPGGYKVDYKKGFGAHDVGVFPNGSVAIVGTFKDEAILGEGGPNETRLDAGKEEDIYFARFRPDGGF